MKIKLLNHACLKISFDSTDTKILFDPWLFGTCFEGGWGLRFNNPRAIEETADCTYLWISHFHSDHLHIPTLKEIFKINPDIAIFANSSFNFQMEPVLRSIGFKKILPLYERKTTLLSNNILITRYPTTGIDNMLYIETSEGNILNYNDVNLPIKAQEKIGRLIGRVDVLLNNYNHAGKITDYPLPEPSIIKERLIKNFYTSASVFNPKYIIPFASSHYYRAPENLEQNKSLIDPDELCGKDGTEYVDAQYGKVIPIKVGDSIYSKDKFSSYRILKNIHQITQNIYDTKQRNAVYFLDELKQDARLYCRKINSGFFYLTIFIPKLIIKISDLDAVVSLRLLTGKLKYEYNKIPHHITVTSQELHMWWNKPFGTDSFVVGAHYEINDKKIFPLQIKILLGLLTENHIDLRSIFKMLITTTGLNFLWNRREEIVSIITGFRFMPNKPRQ